MDYLFKNINILDPVDGEKRNMYLGVSGTKISYLSDKEPEEKPARIIDGENRLLIPGLKNTHTHIAMSALRGVCDDRNLNEWLFDNIIPREAKLDREKTRISALMGMLEAIAGGTTAICDMYFHMPDIGRAAKQLGLRANIGNAVLAMENFDESDRSVTELYELMEEFPHDELIKPVTGVHSIHTTYSDVWKWVREKVEEYDIPMIMHMSEAEVDNETCRRLYGDSPAAVLEKEGLFTKNTLIAHGVWVDERDLEILKRNDVSLSHCPVSNLKLASGIAPVKDYLRHGVNVTIGTDGVASNNSLDMLEEMKFTALLQRRAGMDENTVTAADVFRFATVNAAKALAIDNCGLLKEGYDADIVMLSLDRPGLYPHRNLLSNLVYSSNASDVCLTMVRGRVIYEDGEYPGVDHEKIIHEFLNKVVPEL